MSVVVSNINSSQFVRAVVNGLHAGELLDSFWTSVAIPNGVERLLPISEAGRKALARRQYPGLPWGKIRLHPEREVVAKLADWIGARYLTRHETGWASIDALNCQIDEAVAHYLRGSASAEVTDVYAYEDLALSTFAAAKDTGRRCTYDLPIAYWRAARAIAQEEVEARPDWSKTISLMSDSPDKTSRKDAEIARADRIVVASSFTRNSLLQYNGASSQIIVIPYGAPRPRVARPSARKPAEPMQIIFAGHIAQRKGIAYLVDSLKKLDIPWHLTLAGSIHPDAPSDFRRFLTGTNVTFLGHVPHTKLLEEMARSHVFVFPSLIEGFAMVLNEAMASGLPIITTPHTAGPDLIREGEEGYIVPIRDGEAIAERLTQLYFDEAKRRAMGEAALATAGKRTWSHYENDIRQLMLRVTEGS